MTELFGAESIGRMAGGEPGLVVTIGERSVHAARQAGFNAIGVSEKATPDEALAALRGVAAAVSHASKVILALPDGFDEIEAAALWFFGRWRCYHGIIPSGVRSLAELQMARGPEIVKTVLSVASPYPIEGVFRLDEIPEPPPLDLYEPFGWRLAGRFRPFRGGLVVVTGITGHGKSTWLNFVLVGLAKKYGLRTLMASLEVPTRPWLLRALRRQVDFHFGDFEPGKNYPNGQAGEPQRAETRWADDWIGDHFLFVDRNVRPFSEPLSVSWLVDTAENARMRYGIDALVIDPWNKFEHGREKGENETDYIGRMLNELTTWAKQARTILFVVAHPGKSVMGRDGKPRRPTVFDVSGSMHWGNMADHVVVVDRDKASGNQCQVHIEKSKYRDAGTEGFVHYTFDAASDRFTEIGPNPSSGGDQ